MKFLNDMDKALYEAELKALDIDEITFIKRRRGIVKRLKGNKLRPDFRKSQDTKQQWRKLRTIMMKGIKRFHNSTKGKRFHRQLGTFLAGRNLEDYSKDELKELVVPVSSVLTHTYLEFDYYFDIKEHVDYELFADAVCQRVLGIIQCIDNGEELCEDFKDFLYEVVETSALVKSFADKTGKSPEEVERLFIKSKNIAKEQGRKETDGNFFRFVVGILKKILGLTKSNDKSKETTELFKV